ncbi:MAG TPA: hypothetical protein VHC86_02720 [Opitutaceae bacterium]|nr:hypothetical protein [Opitutaceae bacterium]
MGKALVRFALLAALTVLLARVLLRQHRVGEQLQEDLATLRAKAATAARLEAENARLRAEAASPGESKRPRRREAPPGRGAATGRRSPPAGGHPRTEAKQWKLAGRASPADTFESVLWAATHQEVDTLAAFLAFDPKQRRRAEAFFAELPEATRQQYRSPEAIAATMLAANTPPNLSAMDTLERSGSGDDATLLMRVERDDGTRKDSFFRFKKDAGGWKLLVPEEVLQGYAAQLTGRAALPGATSAPRSAP